MQFQSFSGVYTHIHFLRIRLSTRELSEDARHTNIHTPILTLSRVHKYTYISGRASHALLGAAVLHTRTSSCLLENGVKISIPALNLLAKTHMHLVARSSFTLTGTFPLYATFAIISPVWSEYCQQRRSQCRLYCETSELGTLVFLF